MAINFIDLTGQKFSRLTVIKRVENNKRGGSRWLCKCDCGSEKIIQGAELRKGDTKSCGCLRDEIVSKQHKKYNTYDLTNDYGIGYTSNTNKLFFFDLEDYVKIKNYCWYEDKDGYIVSSDDVRISMHRLVTNCPDDMEVDHKFHNTYDNRKHELRIVTRTQNNMNHKISKNNTSGVKGVNFHKKYNKWEARIHLNNIKIHLGYYDDFAEAVEVRKEAEERYFGEYNYKDKKNNKNKI